MKKVTGVRKTVMLNKSLWKRLLSIILTLSMIMTMLPTNALAAAPVSSIKWNGDSDKAVAVNINAVQNNDRTNASGSRIASNAQNTDFPGIYFIWDSKQKDNGYLKVDANVFGKYESFTLTSKELNTYWDFKIADQPGQQKTTDNCYVFYIPKANDNKNINMVFIGEYKERLKPPELPAPILSLEIRDGKPVMTWSRVSNATSYTIKRATQIGMYSDLAQNLTDTEFTDGTAQSTMTYY